MKLPLSLLALCIQCTSLPIWAAEDVSFNGAVSSSVQQPFASKLYVVGSGEVTYSGEYRVSQNYNGYPVYQLHDYHLFRRLDGKWYLGESKPTENDDTLANTLSVSDTPWTSTFSGGAISLVDKLHVSNSHYPSHSSGWYDLVGDYLGYPLYRNDHYAFYRRNSGEWFLDFNEVDETWEGTIDFTLGAVDAPWLAPLNTGQVAIEAAKEEFQYNDRDVDGKLIIDALIVLTPSAKADILAKNQTPETYLNHRIDALNKTLERSLITSSTVRLLGIHELSGDDFARTGIFPDGSINNISHALNWLSSYRDSYGADKVLLVGSNREPNNNGAYASGDASSYFVNFLPIEHEFGHMMGASHCNEGKQASNFGFPLTGYTPDGFMVGGLFGGTRMCSNNVALYSNPDVELSLQQIEELVGQGLMPQGDYLPLLNEHGKLKMGDEKYANVAKTWRDNETHASQRRSARRYPRGENPYYTRAECAGLYSEEGYQGFIRELCAGETLSDFEQAQVKSILLGQGVHMNLYSDPQFGAHGMCGGEVLRSAFSTPSLTNMSRAQGLTGFDGKLGSMSVYRPEQRKAHFRFDGRFDFYSTSGQQPDCVLQEEDGIRLMPDLLSWSGAAAVMKTPVQGEFEVSFKVRSQIHSEHRHGEGFTFFFGKNAGAYREQSLLWNDLGFLGDGSGYAVQFHDVLNRVALLDGNQTPIGNTVRMSTYTQGQWKEVKVKVQSDNVRVFWEGEEILNQTLALDLTPGHIGFGAGTGFYTSEFMIKDIQLSQP